MGRGTWYYSLEVFLAIVDAFVRSEFEISSWRGARVGVRTFLPGGAIDGSEANRIIRDPKLELESFRFTFDLVPLSYESVDVVIGENWLLRHKAEMMESGQLAKTSFRPTIRSDVRTMAIVRGLYRPKYSIHLGRYDDVLVFRLTKTMAEYEDRDIASCGSKYFSVFRKRKLDYQSELQECELDFAKHRLDFTASRSGKSDN
ncbi:hypothetical protein Tco_0431626 [Tanacetum coccineum]